MTILANQCEGTRRKGVEEEGMNFRIEGDITEGQDTWRVALVDGMAEVQALEKRDWINNCSHLADHFISRIQEKYNQMNEVRIIFDRYDVPHSLNRPPVAEDNDHRFQWPII